MGSLLLLTLLSTPPQLDFRGHAPELVQRTLDAVLPQLEACLVPPPASQNGKPVVPLRHSEHLLQLEVSVSGFVAHVSQEGSRRLEPACAQRLLIRLEFGPSRGRSDTRVIVPLTCTEHACFFPWTPAAEVKPQH